MQAWLTLGCAILLEIAGTISMKLSYGFTRLWPSILIFVFYSASFVALTFAIKRIEVSVVYAVWSAVGTAAVATIGMWYFQETVNVIKIASIVLIIIGVIGVNLGQALD